MKHHLTALLVAVLSSSACDRDPTFVTTKDRPTVVTYGYAKAEGSIIIKEDGFIGPVALVCPSGQASGFTTGVFSGWYSVLVRLEQTVPRATESCRIDVGAPVVLTRTLDLQVAARTDSVVTSRFDIVVPPDPPAIARMDLPLIGIAAGSNYSCAVSASGASYCWGANASGQLGVGSRVATVHPARTVFTDRAQSIDISTVTTCALRIDGRAYCWGTESQFRTPRVVSESLTFTGLKIGGHPFFMVSCGTSDSGLYCWEGSAAPSLQSGLPTVRSVAIGGFHRCAAAMDGALYCWGANAYGQLGFRSASGETITAPTIVQTAIRFMQVAAGRIHTCGLDGSGVAYCWGVGVDGQLGRSQPDEPCYDQFRNPRPCATTDLSPKPVSTDLRFTAIDAQLNHTCAIATSGDLYCWGKGDDGQLGHGKNESSLVPVKVAGGLRYNAVSAGERHTCAIATSGKAYCWGFNGDGALGNGSRVSSNVPVTVWGQE